VTKYEQMYKKVRLLDRALTLLKLSS